ncbi:MAG: hypothetical protein K2X32_05575 [Phycisphaerales bacterium]|nr:hypothetical protein [Phycisphaerales bacterium]
MAAGLTASAAYAGDPSPFLTGFLLYRSNADGSANNNPAYFYTTNGNIGAARQTLTPSIGPAQTVGISFLLTPGANTFTFATNFPVDPGLFAGVQLYFNTTGTPFQPIGAGVAPDLAAFVGTSSPSPLANPAAGAGIIDFGNSFGPLAAYSGATSVTVGNWVISVSALSINRTPTGSMTLSVVAIPSPAAAALLGLGGLMAAGGGRRRRR